jgi:hypothetical protein
MVFRLWICVKTPVWLPVFFFAQSDEFYLIDLQHIKQSKQKKQQKKSIDCCLYQKRVYICIYQKRKNKTS